MSIERNVSCSPQRTSAGTPLARSASPMNSVFIIVVALLVVALGYRYYSAFIAAKILALDDRRTTPAHTMKDGTNYDPTNKFVLFGHHFAAISGAGPLIGEFV